MLHLASPIMIGPDRAYPLHFTRPQMLLLLPVLPLLCVCELNVSVIALYFRNEIWMESVSFSFLDPIL